MLIVCQKLTKWNAFAFKQIVQLLIQITAEVVVILFAALGHDGEHGTAFIKTQDAIVVRTADDLAVLLADLRKFFFQDRLDLIKRGSGRDFDLKRQPGVVSGQVDDIADIAVADDLDIVAASDQFC